MDTWALFLVAAQSTAQAAAAVVQAAAVSDDPNPLRSMTLSAMGIFYVQKWLKTRVVFRRFVETFPGSDKWAHRGVAAIGAFLTMAGIHYTFNGTLLGGGTYIIQLPPLQQMFSTLTHASIDFGGIFGLQQVIYEATRQPGYRDVAPRLPPGA